MMPAQQFRLHLHWATLLALSYSSAHVWVAMKGESLFYDPAMFGVYLFGSVVGAILGTAMDREKKNSQRSNGYWAQQTLLSLLSGMIITPAFIRWLEIPLLHEYVLMISAAIAGAGWICFKLSRTFIPKAFKTTIKSMMGIKTDE